MHTEPRKVCAAVFHRPAAGRDTAGRPSLTDVSGRLFQQLHYRCILSYHHSLAESGKNKMLGIAGCIRKIPVILKQHGCQKMKHGIRIVLDF